MEKDLSSLLDWFDNEPSLWWFERTQEGLGDEQERFIALSNGFGAISRRSSSPKPMIAAVNGSAYGGGTELVLNCDIVIASEEATFALPEVKRGVTALAGALEWAKQINLSSPDSIQSTKRALLLNKQKADVEEVVVAHMRSEESKRAYAGENMKASRYFPCHLSHTHDHQGGSYGIYPVGPSESEVPVKEASQSEKVGKFHVAIWDQRAPLKLLAVNFYPLTATVMSTSESSTPSPDDGTFNRWRRRFSLMTGLGVSEEERMAGLEAHHARTCEKWKRELMHYSQY
ncbi:hypothetical protein NLI96_g6631 [Meripilus lineatus]|uniref:Uncharacterized protein n=1 Tax=Meripilus lineatus TaxID=2056292 RepID=A0AAD5V2E2_9APHY|nr:hypothetical protein NLI96_g6631 [Physisporinus lineatus]